MRLFAGRVLLEFSCELLRLVSLCLNGQKPRSDCFCARNTCCHLLDSTQFQGRSLVFINNDVEILDPVSLDLSAIFTARRVPTGLIFCFIFVIHEHIFVFGTVPYILSQILDLLDQEKLVLLSQVIECL